MYVNKTLHVLSLYKNACAHYLDFLCLHYFEIIQQHEQFSYIVNNFIYTRPPQGIPAVIVNGTIYIF